MSVIPVIPEIASKVEPGQLKQLARHSREVLKAGQAKSGAIVACPTFEVYRYSWLRDGSFCAYALDLAGDGAEGAAFHRWVGRVVGRYEQKVDSAIQRYRAGEKLTDADFLNTRYTLDGSEEEGHDWWNFQLDGYGTWLWAVSRHFELFPDNQLKAELQKSVEIVVRYLAAFWQLPNYDCWEENREGVHPSTLAALYGGLKAAAMLYSESPVCRAGRKQSGAIAAFVKSNGLHQDSLIKTVGLNEVDASLLGAAMPYGLFPRRGKLMRATIARIEQELTSPQGGVYRYRRDVYYGGGEWVLLTAWLGWYYESAGRREEAQSCLNWVAQQADFAGNLPEQVAHNLLSPIHLPGWEERWGKSASPLLWSHAMYLILYTALYGEID